MKNSIKNRLEMKSLGELKSIAKRLNFPLRSNGKKAEHVHALSSFFKCKETWKIISG